MPRSTGAALPFSWTRSCGGWLLELPAEQERAFWQEMQAYEEERGMPYITSVERLGLERGLAQGREEGKREALRRLVQARFQAVPEALERRIAMADGAVLDQMLDRVATVQGVDDL